jgi:mannose-1-phosphate guanylyltransferase
MQAIILAGGLGTRLRPLTLETPKPMLDVAGKPHLEYQVDWLRKNGITDIVFCLGYRWHHVAKYFEDGVKFGVNISYSVEKDPLGTAGAVKNAENLLRFSTCNMFLVTNGDILTNIDITKLIDAHKTYGAEITLALTPVDDPKGYGVVDISSFGLISAFMEKPVNPPSNYINAGIYVLDRKVLNHIPKGGFTMFESMIFPTFASRGKVFGLKYPNSYWLDIGTHEHYTQANNDVKNLKFFIQ